MRPYWALEPYVDSSFLLIVSRAPRTLPLISPDLLLIWTNRKFALGRNRLLVPPSVYGLLLIASPVALAPVPTARVYSASKYGIVSMQGHDALFARRLSIAFSCFSHLDIRGFCRRRFDRFVIVQVASQSWLRVVSLVEYAG